MLPSKGLTPAQLGPRISRQSLQARCRVSRQFSTIPRTVAASHSRQLHALRSSNWRTGPRTAPAALAAIPGVRHGSWYAPWTWGSSSTPPAPAPEPAAPPVEVVIEKPPTPEPAVTTQTPELAPGTVETPPVVNATSATDSTTTVEQLLETHDAPGAPSAELLNSEHYVGYLHDLGIDYGWGVTSSIESVLEHIHVYTGWGWGASIIATTLLIRSIVMLAQIRSSDTMAQMAHVRPMTSAIQAKAQDYSLPADVRNAANMEVFAMYRRAGIKQRNIYIMPVVQAALGISAFRLIRAMNELPVPGMQDGGFLWFTDLTVPDPYWVLPTLAATAMWLNAKVKTPEMEALPTGSKILVTNVLPSVAFIIVAWQSAALQLTLMIGGAFAILASRVLRNPAVRRSLKLTPFPNEDTKRLADMAKKGDINVHDLKYNLQNIKYQAPTQQPKGAAAPATTPLSKKLTLKSGLVLPTHLAYADPNSAAAKGEKHAARYANDRDRDLDYDFPPTGNSMEAWRKWFDWFKRNHLNFRYIRKRFSNWRENMMARAGYGSDGASGAMKRRRQLSEQKSKEYAYAARQKRKNR